MSLAKHFLISRSTKKQVRENRAPLMAMDLSQATMNKSKAEKQIFKLAIKGKFYFI